MDNDFKTEVLKLHPEFHTIYGPYIRKYDNRKIVILYDGRRTSGKLLARVTLDVKLGRKLTKGETVDHKDEDKTNDNPLNLQVLTRIKNIQKGFENGSLKPITITDAIRKIRSINAKGYKNPQARFTYDEVVELRKLYNEGVITVKYICDKYKIGTSSVKAMLNKITYSNVN